MLCERCKKNQATMRLTRIINNKKQVINLCADCARETGNQIVPTIDGIGSILSGLMGLDNLWKNDPQLSVKKCPVCGMTQAEISRSGKLGCSECYITFIDEIRPLLRKIHGNCLHHGSVPMADKAESAPVKPEVASAVNIKAEDGPPPREDSVEALKLQMKDAIAREDFETAAKLRDEIKAKEA